MSYNLRHALFFITSVSLMPFFFCQPPTSNWHKISWINYLLFSVFLLYVTWKGGPPRKFARFVLFRPIKKRSFKLLCVLDLFSQRWQSTLFHTFCIPIVSFGSVLALWSSIFILKVCIIGIWHLCSLLFSSLREERPTEPGIMSVR